MDSIDLRKLVESIDDMDPRFVDETTGSAAMTGRKHARAVGVQDVRVIKLAEEVEETFKERFTPGPQRSTKQTKVELINTCSENTIINQGTKRFWTEMGQDNPIKTLFRDPATAEVITELKKRVEIKLPTDFKEFLAVTNGYGESWNGVSLDPPLHSTTEIRWIDEEEDYFLDLALELLDREVSIVARDDYSNIWETWSKVGQVMKIGTEDIDNVWLLPPKTVDRVRKAYLEIVDSEKTSVGVKQVILNDIKSFAGSREKFERLDGCVLTWASGGAVDMRGFPRFKDFLPDEVRRSNMDILGDGPEEKKERKCSAYSCR